MNGDLAIDVQDVTKSFNGRTVVDHLALQVRKGEIFGFLGPNGSGKTTFIRMLCGLLRADDGRGTCLGHDIITESDAIKRQVGYMTQKFSLYEDLTIEENLDFIAQIYGLDHRKDRVAHCLKQLGLHERRRQLAGTLSGGWKQRLALSSCLIHEPSLLLLDEPTAGVDPKARREFWEEINALAAEGLTVLVTTHYMDEAERCHRLAYIAYGKLLAQGTVQEVIDNTRLATWQIQGAAHTPLSEELRALPEIQQVVAFGSDLHVSSQNIEGLETIAARYQEGEFRWKRIASGLEDVFICLMGTARDNFREEA
jgi:ABC-2 type transport system ATP-binding protein